MNLVFEGKGCYMNISKESQNDIHEYLELEKSIKWFSKFEYAKDIILDQQNEMSSIREKLEAHGIILE